MAIKIEGYQTSLIQLFPVVLQNFQQGIAHDFGNRASYAQLDDAWQAAAAQGQKTSEIQILSDDDRSFSDRMIQNDFIRITCLAYFSPMKGLDPMGGEKVLPPGREIFIDDELHDASNSCVSEAVTSAANSRAALMEFEEREG